MAQLTAVFFMNAEATKKSNPLHPMPFVRVELALLSVKDGELRVLLSKRAETPAKGKWALPGGVLRIDQDSSLDAAAARVAQERLNGVLAGMKQVTAVGRAGVDPRATWTLSVLFRCLVSPDIEVIPGKRVEALEWHAIEPSASGQIAFDHADLIARAVGSVRTDIRNLSLDKGWLAEEFTIPELQTHFEAILGEKLDKVTFRRRLDAGGFLQALEGQTRVSGAHRPAQVYRLRQ